MKSRQGGGISPWSLKEDRSGEGGGGGGGWVKRFKGEFTQWRTPCMTFTTLMGIFVDLSKNPCSKIKEKFIFINTEAPLIISPFNLLQNFMKNVEHCYSCRKSYDIWLVWCCSVLHNYLPPPWRGEAAYLTKRFQPSASTRRACQSDAATFDQNIQIFLSTLPRTGFNTEVCSYLSL